MNRLLEWLSWAWHDRLTRLEVAVVMLAIIFCLSVLADCIGEIPDLE